MASTISYMRMIRVQVRVQVQGSRAGNSKLGSATQCLWVQIPTLLLLGCKALHKSEKSTREVHRSEVTEERKINHLREGNFYP